MQKISSFVAKVSFSLGCTLAAAHAYSQSTQSTCRFSSVTGIAFGLYDDTSSTPRDTTANIVVNCTRNGGPPNVNVTLALGPSATSGSSSTRSLRQGGGNSITYNLYRDSSRGSIWGQTPGVDTVTQSLSIPNKSTATTTFTIFGRIGELQSASVGTYGDSVVATVSY